jgi:hypothetical protein
MRYSDINKYGTYLALKFTTYIFVNLYNLKSPF